MLAFFMIVRQINMSTRGVSLQNKILLKVDFSSFSLDFACSSLSYCPVVLSCIFALSSLFALTDQSLELCEALPSGLV